MAHVFKLVSVLAVIAFSILPGKGHPAAPAQPAPVRANGGGAAEPVRFDGRTPTDWSRLQARWQAEFDAAQAKAKADAAAAAAAAAARSFAPRGAAPAPVHYSGSIQALIQQVFQPQGQTAVAWAERVAACESGYNPNSYNASSGASGLFQFLPSTWAHTPYAGQSVFDPVANTNAAAWMYSRDHGSAWSCK